MTDAAELYRALLSSGRLSSLRRLTYRCAHGRCLLLEAVETPMGVVLHQIRFKQSHEVNQSRSSAGGRAKNTSDGDNHWLPRTYWLTESALSIPTRPDVIGGETGRQSIQCDHIGVPDVLLSGDDFRRDWDAGTTRVLVRGDGSRYAVD